MEHVNGEELERHVLNYEQVTVKQEVIDEGYRVALTDKEVCNTNKCITDINHAAENKVDVHLLGNLDITVGKSELVIETPVEYIKHEVEGKDNTEVEKETRKEIEVKIDTENEVNKGQEDTDTVALEKGSIKIEQAENGINETCLNTAAGISVTDCKTESENTFGKDDEEVLLDSGSAAHRELVKESAEKENQSMLEKKGYICEICKKTFIKKSSLSSHEMTHTGETPFKCQFCNKGFNVRSNLNVHLRIHTGQRPHMCEICQKTFRQLGQLKTHERIHNGEKPYICSMCTRSFRSSSALITHQRTHTGERPFPCDLCSRSFSTSTSLKTHRITHSGTMLYDCPVCGRQFNRKNNLNVHIKRHNKNRKFSCPKCSNGFVMRAHLLGHLKRAHKIDINADQLKHFEVLDSAEDYTVGIELKNEEEEMKTENICDDTKVGAVGPDNDKNEGLDIKDEFDR